MHKVQKPGDANHDAGVTDGCEVVRKMEEGVREVFFCRDTLANKDTFFRNQCHLKN